MGLTKEFLKYGAKLDNVRWSVSALAKKPRQAVITVWEDRFPQKGKKRTYRIDTTAWGNRAGRTGTLIHLAVALEQRLPVRMVMARSMEKGPNTFEARPEWIGYVKEVDENTASVVFERSDVNPGPPMKAELVSAAQEEAESLVPQIDSTEDARKWAMTTIALRQGQSAFRSRLLKAYDGRCAITGCEVVATLEAAHILPYRGTHTNAVNNGLLLRADIHTLFDLGLIWVDAKSKVQVASSLLGSSYEALKGRQLSVPSKKSNAPLLKYLAEHAKRAQEKR